LAATLSANPTSAPQCRRCTNAWHTDIERVREPPIGFEGENFYNLVAGFDTDESPEVVTTILHDIEQRLGRERGPSRFCSRTIDLDLLLYSDLIREQATLQLPRLEIDEYACVLRPLAELAPKARHPRSGETFAALWARFDKTTQPLTAVALELAV
jgi:2-amino-4-hydroxy-6-hydroxymethyldihydropteridine diphosphokinase